jgi:hypothetical protein
MDALSENVHAFLCTPEVQLTKYLLEQKLFEQKLYRKLKHILCHTFFYEATIFWLIACCLNQLASMCP